MAVVDVIILAVAALGTVRGFQQGLVRGIGGIAGVAGGILACHLLGGAAAAKLGELVPEVKELPGSPYTGEALAYVLLFAAVCLCATIAAHAVSGTLRILRLGAADRIGGAAFGTLKFLLLLSVAFNALYILAPDGSLFHSSELLGGRCFAAVMRLAPWIWGLDLFPDLGTA